MYSSDFRFSRGQNFTKDEESPFRSWLPLDSIHEFGRVCCDLFILPKQNFHWLHKD